MVTIVGSLSLVVLLLLLYDFAHIVNYSAVNPRYTIPVESDQTVIDRIMAPLLACHPNDSCLMLLQNNLDAFAIRAMTACEAGRSLDLQYYIWRDDLTGCLLASEVFAAADRGVKVRLLLDDINVWRSSRLLLRAFNSHPNIDVKLFNPIRIRRYGLMRVAKMLFSFLSINRRMHNKIWIVDGRIALVGGRNIGDQYFDAAAKRNFFDADLFIGGRVVDDAAKIFDRFWNSSFAIPLSAFFPQSDKILHLVAAKMNATKTSEAAKPYLQKLAQTESVHALFEGDWNMHWTKNIHILSDPPEKIANQQPQDWLFPKLQWILSNATEKIDLISPYFVPGKGGLKQLVDRCKKGIDISILTNSLAATDVFLVHSGYQRYRKQLLCMGIHLYELKPFGKPERTLLGSSRASLHTKACLIDHRLGFIGSFNFDQRSVMLNSEMGVFFEQPAIVQSLQKAFITYSSASCSYQLSLVDDKVRWQDTRDHTTLYLWQHEPQTSWWHRAVTKMISYLPIDSQL